ncbi:translation initiation factor IF-2-like [Phyllostomus hastatus]|uniref:translation initiation factor IF-2-like n=1 Tax=Phyllostomus hastatus TaxID=9423 RepID=UPI001E684A99|nr:translation initiation factor IF-2-like [Phyllostomus hastatus]
MVKIAFQEGLPRENPGTEEKPPSASARGAQPPAAFRDVSTVDGFRFPRLTGEALPSRHHPLQRSSRGRKDLGTRSLRRGPASVPNEQLQPGGQDGEQSIVQRAWPQIKKLLWPRATWQPALGPRLRLRASAKSAGAAPAAACCRATRGPEGQHGSARAGSSRSLGAAPEESASSRGQGPPRRTSSHGRVPKPESAAAAAWRGATGPARAQHPAPRPAPSTRHPARVQPGRSARSFRVPAAPGTAPALRRRGRRARDSGPPRDPERARHERGGGGGGLQCTVEGAVRPRENGLRVGGRREVPAGKYGAAVCTEAGTARLPRVPPADAHALAAREAGGPAPPAAGLPRGPLPGLSSLCCDTADEEGPPLRDLGLTAL